MTINTTDVPGNSSSTEVIYYSLDNLSSSQTSALYIHILILDIILLLVGLTGNALVFYIYHYKFKSTVFTLLVRALALADLVSVSVNIPVGILFKFVYIYPNDGPLCGIYLFVEHFVFCFEGLLFIIIAVQRYRKLCKVFNEQIHFALAVKLLTAAFCFAGGTSFPLLFSITGQYVTVPYKDGYILATTCDYNQQAKESGLAVAGAVLLNVEFLLITAVLASLYFKISQAYRRHETNSRARVSRRSITSRHMTKIFFVMTIFFQISITPVLVCSIIISTTKELRMSLSEFVVFDIGFILPYFHSIINPLIYGIAIKDFRCACKNLFRVGKCPNNHTAMQRNPGIPLSESS